MMKPATQRAPKRPKKAVAGGAVAASLAEKQRVPAGGVKKVIVGAVDIKAGRFMALAGSNVVAHDAVMKGVSGRLLTDIWKNKRGSLPPEAILRAIGVSPRTASRIQAEPDKQLDRHTTDGIYRLESVRALASDVLGGAEAADEWLNTEAIGLEFRKPIDLLSTYPGAEAVKTLLQRMKHGVYA